MFSLKQDIELMRSMDSQYSYQWYIQQFEAAKDTAEKFILSVDEARFLQPPADDRWCIAEIYSHLINYGNLYFNNFATAITNTQETTNDLEQSFQPRWLVRKLVNFFEPPYKIKMKTIDSMQPDPVSDYNRMELLDEYVNLQDRFLAQIEKGQHRHVNLAATKMKHPFISWINMTLTECLALAEVHQRRHQWQAEQALEALKEKSQI